VFLVSNRGRGKLLKKGCLRISQLTNKSTPTVTDASHGLHMPESQNDSDITLVGPQEELRGPSGYTPRLFTSGPKREAK